MKPPFTVSSDAERYIRGSLEYAPPEGMEPLLTCAFRRKVRDKDGRLVERFDAEHYVLGSSQPSEHVGYTRYKLFGHTIALHPDTAAKLQGKVLIMRRTDKIPGVDRTSEILVAVPVDEATKT